MKRKMNPEMEMDVDFNLNVEELISALWSKQCSITYRADVVFRTVDMVGDIGKIIHLAMFSPRDFGLVHDARPQYVWERACTEELSLCPILAAPFLFLYLHRCKLLSENDNIHVVSRDSEGNIFCINILYFLGGWQTCISEFDEFRRQHTTLENKFVFRMP